ncbi:MAG: glycosyltransferase family 4 protein [Huintestinicola sp.]
MKIGINIQPVLHSGKSGIGFYQHELMKALLEKDKDNHYYLNYFDLGGKKTEAAKAYLTENSELDCCTWFNASLYQMIWSVLPIVPYRMFFKSRPDITAFFNYYHPPFARGKKLLVVYDTVIKDFPETVRFKTKTMLRLTLSSSIRRADRIITISEFSKQQIMKHYDVPESRITVIPCAADRKRFYPMNLDSLPEETALKYGIDAPYYLYLGNLEPRKNIVRLIEAYKLASDRQADIPKLVLSGGKGWMYEEIFSKVNELRLENKVVFTGYVEDDDVPVLINGAKAFCFPSLYEGFGMPPLEAMSCGVPVIVSDCSSLPEVVGDCGIKVDPYSTESIADALIKILDDDLASEQSLMGIEQADKFSWDKSADMLIRVMNELTDNS